MSPPTKDTSSLTQFSFSPAKAKQHSTTGLHIQARYDTGTDCPTGSHSTLIRQWPHKHIVGKRPKCPTSQWSSESPRRADDSKPSASTPRSVRTAPRSVLDSYPHRAEAKDQRPHEELLLHVRLNDMDTPSATRVPHPPNTYTHRRNKTSRMNGVSNPG